MAKNNATELKVLPYLEEIVKEYALELVDLEFIKEGANWYLRVYIDKEGGVDLVDCEKVSRTLDEKLDEIDPITQQYILEVSSPGIDRPLKKPEDFERFADEVIDVKLYKAQDGKKQYQGRLVSLKDDILSIDVCEDEDKEEIITLIYKEVASVRLAILF